MKRFIVALVLVSLVITAPSFAQAKDAWFEVSKTIVVPPSSQVGFSIVDGKIVTEGEPSLKYPPIVDKAPQWLRGDLAITFNALAKSPTVLPEKACVTSATLLPEKQEVLIISGMGKPPVVLRLPNLETIEGIIPPSVDANSKLAFADLDRDGMSDLMVCPPNGGWFYLLGPTFSIPVKTDVSPELSRAELYPITNPLYSDLAEVSAKPKTFTYLDVKGEMQSLDQSRFISNLPPTFGALTSLGLVFIDNIGDLRIIKVKDDLPISFSSKTSGILPSFDQEIHASLYRKTLWVGTLEGDLFSCEMNNDGQFVASKTPFLQGLGRRFCPAVVDMDNDGNPDLVYSNEEGIFVAKGPSWKNATKLDVPEKGPIAVAQLRGDASLDIAVAGKGEVKILVGPKFTNIETIKVEGCGDDLTVAAGDVTGDSKADIVLGQKDGKICVLEADNPFSFIDVGDYSAPCIGDVDDDWSNELIVSNVDGKMFCYKNIDHVWTEFRSWSFIPSPPYLSVADYFARYYKEAELLPWEDDQAAVQAYANELANCKPEYFDEIAFSIANTSPEMLRTMQRMGQVGIFARNAKCIYDMAAKLPYVEIVEKKDHTTLLYKTGGGMLELPMMDYYWYVVHPKVLYELPIAIDASWWDKSHEELGMSFENWVQHNENIYANQQKAVFWREGMVGDASFGEPIGGLAEKCETLEEARLKVHGLTYPGESRHNVFGYLTQDLFPWLIYKKHYGSCGEQSIMFGAIAKTVLIPCRIVVDRGEDHQWNEVWVDGVWHHLEPSGDQNNYDMPWSYEGPDHKYKSVSDVTSWRGDDNHFSTVPEVSKTKSKYTEKNESYTQTSKITFKVVDSKNTPIDGALVLMRSGWNNVNATANWEYTNTDGVCVFNVGWEPYYIIDCITPYGVTGLSRYAIKENSEYKVVLQVPGVAPEVKFEAKPLPEKGDLTLQFAEIKEEIRPPNFVTSSGYRLGSYLSEKYSYHGVTYFRRQLAPTQMLVNGVQTEQGKAIQLSSSGKAFIQNASQNIWKIVTVKARVQVSEFALKVTPKTGTIKVSSGSSFDLAVDIAHTTPLVGLEWSWDQKAWNPLAFEGAKIETGLGGPPSPGRKTIHVRATSLFETGTKSDTASFEIELLPSTMFKSQPVHQDPPDPLQGVSWKIGPFTIPAGERYLRITTDSASLGLDLDIFLYLDANGDGKPEQKELVASSTTPTNQERILIPSPKQGPYILYCQGCTCEQEGSTFDVAFSCTPKW